MIDSSALLAALKAQLRTLQGDLRERADDSATTWGAALQGEHAEALRRERTGLSWTAWRDNEVDQAAVAWILATTFVRFCEDNDLLVGAILDGMPVPVGWIAGPGDRILRARENQTAYFRINTSHHDRDWLQQSFRVLAAQPAGASLVDPKHNPVWTAEISAEAAKGLVDFWRRTYDDGTLVHDFTDPGLDTRFLGDLYQDLSDHAKKTYALLQTPVFVEEFILDRTLTPAIAEFGVDGLKLIDPTCGSGHFLLGGFERLNQQWATEAPSMDRKQRVRKAMDSIHGVDLNPFAVAIARFRLTVAGILAAGEKSMVGVEEWGFHLAIGDSLLGQQGVTKSLFGDDTYTYATEDLDEYADILKPGRYHVVVGNPPYITVKDKVLSLIYRKAYTTAAGKYALSVPFMELFFRLAIKGGSGQGAGHVGQITSNSFMKREFGKKVIEDLFAGYHIDNPVDLTHVIDTSGAYIPGHGTPTVIVIGRRRRPVASEVRAVLGVRGEPGTPEDPSKGIVWREIIEHIDNPGFDGTYVSVLDLARKTLSTFPWSLSGGGASDLKNALDEGAAQKLAAIIRLVGVMGMTNIDDAFLAPREAFARSRVEPDLVRNLVTGELVRDYGINRGDHVFFPYNSRGLLDIHEFPRAYKWAWPVRTEAWNRATFSKNTYREEGRTWWEWHQIALDRVDGPVITFAFVATHNHFVLDRGGKVFNRSAPVIKLSEGATEEQYLELLGVLNSSTACFWLKQVSHNKGRPSADGAGADEPWEHRFEFTGTKLQDYPLPRELPVHRGRNLDRLRGDLSSWSPHSVIDRWLTGRSDEDLSPLLSNASTMWYLTRRQLVFEQEELDWEVYRLYGLVDEDLTSRGEMNELAPEERAFAVHLASSVEAGEADTTWFVHHNHMFSMVTELPEAWPTEYRQLVERRLELIKSDRAVRLLERPEFKRRWATIPWAKQLQDALEAAILDRLEDEALWGDYQGPITRSVSQLADLLRNDVALRELTRVLTGNHEADLGTVIGSLASAGAVPYVAAYRYKPSGLEKFREWQSVWDMQRREDSGEKVTITLPPNYSDKDFQRSTYWKARGKLDMHKERFVLYPGVGREGDSSPVLGWAGWNHRDQAVALVREVLSQQALGASNEMLVPMVAGLVELEPWLHQFHTELEAEFGSSAAQAVTSQIDQFLAQLQMTRDDVGAWRPPAATRGRRRSA